MKRAGVLFLAMHMLACPAASDKTTPRQTYVPPKQNIAPSEQKPIDKPSPVASPAGTEVDDTPVPESETPVNPGTPETSRAYGGGIGSNCGGSVSCVNPSKFCAEDYPSGQCTKA